MKRSNGVEEVNRFIMFMNNTSPRDLVELLFGEVYGGYEQKWYQLYQDGFNRFWSALDDEKRNKLMDAAMERYG